jgi:hypothetical protein
MHHMSILRKHLLVLVAMMAVGVGAAVAPATAAPAAPTAPARTEATAGWPKVTRTTVGGASVGTMSTAAACPITMYGYRGTLLCGAVAMEVEWSPGRFEFFGIATDRTIWHVWPANGWRAMPGNGHADDIYDAWWEGATRRVYVHVDSNDSYWYASDPGSGWNGWTRW